MTSLKFNSRQKYEMYVVFMNNKSETSCVSSFSSISHLLVWTVLVFCISTDLSAPKLWINPLCWIFYCLPSVCSRLWVLEVHSCSNEYGNYSQWCHTYVLYMRLFTQQTFWLTVEKAQVALTVIQHVSAGKGGIESIKKKDWNHFKPVSRSLKRLNGLQSIF